MAIFKIKHVVYSLVAFAYMAPLGMKPVWTGLQHHLVLSNCILETLGPAAQTQRQWFVQSQNSSNPEVNLQSSLDVVFAFCISL